MKFAGFSARFCWLLSLLRESKYVEEMDPQPSNFIKTLAFSKLKENAEYINPLPFKGGFAVRQLLHQSVDQ